MGAHTRAQELAVDAVEQLLVPEMGGLAEFNLPPKARAYDAREHGHTCVHTNMDVECTPHACYSITNVDNGIRSITKTYIARPSSTPPSNLGEASEADDDDAGGGEEAADHYDWTKLRSTLRACALDACKPVLYVVLCVRCIRCCWCARLCL